MSPQNRSRKPHGASARINVLREKYFIALFSRNIPQNRRTAGPQTAGPQKPQETANRRTKSQEIFPKSSASLVRGAIRSNFWEGHKFWEEQNFRERQIH